MQMNLKYISKRVLMIVVEDLYIINKIRLKIK